MLCCLRPRSSGALLLSCRRTSAAAAAGLRGGAFRRIRACGRAAGAHRGPARRVAACAARLAPCCPHRGHAVSRREPATGGARDHQRHQWRLPHRLLCRADAFRRLGAVAHAAAAIVLAAGAVSFVGAGLLAAGGGPATPPTVGDGLVLIADLAWAIGIALTPIFLVKTERPLTLAFSQYAVCAALGAIGSVVFESAKPADFLRRRLRSCSPASFPAPLAIPCRSSRNATRRRPRRR